MPKTSLPELLGLEVSALEPERAEASMGSSAEASTGLLAAAAEWLVREAVAARSAVQATTISTSARIGDAAGNGPHRLLGRRIYVDTTSEEWTVDVEAGSGKVVARVEVVLSFREGLA
jgi:hypothetical protein